MYIPRSTFQHLVESISRSAKALISSNVHPSRDLPTLCGVDTTFCQGFDQLKCTSLEAPSNTLWSQYHVLPRLRSAQTYIPRGTFQHLVESIPRSAKASISSNVHPSRDLPTPCGVDITFCQGFDQLKRTSLKGPSNTLWSRYHVLPRLRSAQTYIPQGTFQHLVESISRSAKASISSNIHPSRDLPTPCGVDTTFCQGFDQLKCTSLEGPSNTLWSRYHVLPRLRSAQTYIPRGTFQRLVESISRSAKASISSNVHPSRDLSTPCRVNITFCQGFDQLK
ncbi:UNVERIFIED_CONTAM: hypothetical protein FKN15_045617 [Acipenser sinensis]